MTDFRDLFQHTQTIAVVGCSDKPYRTSHRIATYLQSVGFRILPINPHIKNDILGETCYPNLLSVPTEIKIDLVNIFRQPRYTASVVQEVLLRMDLTQERPVIWTQMGVSSEEARRIARTNGLTYITNRCTMVEHAYLV
ncbi:MAG TPA: CoA-binding protein [Rhodothermales bacterium]|nr:CoA-binding protein [Rhodothermales bacterium]